MHDREGLLCILLFKETSEYYITEKEPNIQKCVLRCAGDIRCPNCNSLRLTATYFLPKLGLRRPTGDAQGRAHNPTKMRPLIRRKP